MDDSAARPFEERVALAYMLVIGVVGFLMLPLNIALELEGPWVLLSSFICAHCFGTYWLFRTRRIGRHAAGWSLFLLGGWSIAWYFMNYSGSRGRPWCSSSASPR